MTGRRVIVVGAGISGLAAALDLAEGGWHVTIVEAAERVGGILATAPLAGIPVDMGAEAMLATRPEGVALAARVGLADRLVAPRTSAALVLARDALRPLPRRTLLGIPGDLDALASSAVLTRTALARVTLDRHLPGPLPDADASVAEIVTRRMGREIVDVLVDPLLGGVYAGSARGLSLDATVPRLAARMPSAASLTDAVAPLVGAGSGAGQPFRSIDGGMGLLPRAVAAAAQAAGARAILGSLVTAIAWSTDAVTVRTHAGDLDADHVILAIPTIAAARLLAVQAPDVASLLDQIAWAHVGVIQLALDPSVRPRLPDASGALIPATAGYGVKALTLLDRKWPHLAGGPVLLRASVGRAGDERLAAATDAEVIDAALADLQDILAVRLEVIDARLTRWSPALAQYAPGHRGRIAQARAGLSGAPVSLIGGGYDGVGIPACIGSAQAAVAALLTARS